MRYYKGSLTIIVHETDANEQDSCIHRIQVEGEQFFTQIPVKNRIRRPANLKRRGDDSEELYRKLDSPVLWVRVDPDFELLRRIEVHQAETMWFNQLEKETTNITGLIEAMKYLSKTEKYDAILKFDEILNSSSYHYKARIKAAYALARIS